MVQSSTLFLKQSNCFQFQLMMKVVAIESLVGSIFSWQLIVHWGVEEKEDLASVKGY
jgi:hypothetical protein